jgi:anaerobic dimethyl sulfoxide reductase subunit B
MSQYAFFVDSDACSGCKTCQVACKDKHDVPAGVHWRKVYEVTAGGWEKKDDSWIPSVIAYHLSVACHHCIDPVCAAHCPSDAIWKRPDGIVLIDDSACTRCRKCEIDCPYSAIRWDPYAATVRKCDFCLDNLAAGIPPACVSACPNRALGYGDYDELRKERGGVNRVFPMADPAIAQPAIVIAPHRNTAIAEGLKPEVSNAEEI